MRLIFRRALALLLCLCLVPMAALASPGAVGFSLQAQLDPAGLPAAWHQNAQGIADLMDILHVEGTLATAPDGDFDLHTTLLLNGNEATRTQLRLCGNPSAWCVESSLLGDEAVLINLGGLLEFAMKGYHHLELPLQRVALLVSPYVHTSAFVGLNEVWQAALITPDSLTLPQADLLALMQQLADVAASDRTLQHWIEAVALEAGYDEPLKAFFAELPAWAESITDETGLTITRDGSAERWQIAGHTLFTREADGSWALNVPAALDGMTLQAAGSPAALRLSLLDADAQPLLRADASATALPDTLPISEPFEVQLKAEGLLLPGPINLRCTGDPTADGAILRLFLDGAPLPCLTLTMTLSPADLPVPDFPPEALQGFPILSSSDVTLATFVQAVQEPLIRGLWPLLVEIPASSFQTLMNAVEDSGILGVLTEGLGNDYGD